MSSGLGWSVLTIGLLGATAAFAENPPTRAAAAKHRPSTAASVGRSSAPPASASSRQLWDSLVRGSPDQQAAERKDNEMAGIKPLDHQKDDFFSDWRGLR